MFRQAPVHSVSQAQLCLLFSAQNWKYIEKKHTHIRKLNIFIGAENSLSHFCLTITKPFPNSFYLKETTNY